MTLLRSLVPLLALSAACMAACDKPDTEARSSPPPPPVASARPAACAGGGGAVTDAVSAAFFPRTVGGYCVDPQGEVRTYGEQGKLDMDAVCTTAFDGECAIYTQLGLKRLVSLHYVDGGGGSGTVDVYLSRFADSTGAYGMFTKRVVADSDPAEPTTPRPLAAGAAAAIGTGRAYVWKDAYLVELQYNNEQETPEALARSSARVLAAVATGIGANLPGSSDLPPAVEALPVAHRVVSGVQLVPRDALGVIGLGPLAIGYYSDGATRYRLVALTGADEAKTAQAWKAVRGRPGALPVAGVGEEAVAVAVGPASPGGEPREYVFARRGALVAGAGDEDLAGGANGSAKRLSREDKVSRLREWLTSLPAGAPKGKPSKG